MVVVRRSGVGPPRGDAVGPRLPRAEAEAEAEASPRRAAAPVVGHASVKGMHGYFPGPANLDATLLLMGKGVAAGKDLGQVDMRAIATTVIAGASEVRVGAVAFAVRAGDVLFDRSSSRRHRPRGLLRNRGPAIGDDAVRMTTLGV